METQTDVYEPPVVTDLEADGPATVCAMVIISTTN
jgi:hypothetical protein